jgi:tRNA pseudouridine55 synthase
MAVENGRGDAETRGRGDAGKPNDPITQRPNDPITPSGVVVVHKPGGITSHDVVNRLRRIYGTRRVGHAGTLDPLATGVLVVCLGQATRIIEYLACARKEYVAGVVFGITTDTEDATGNVLAETDASALTEADVQAVLPRFRGAIRQTPPMVSAVHHEGRRLYELARQGVMVEREARPVEIFRLELAAFNAGRRAAAILRVECSTGTYVRTLAADIGAALGVGGTMKTLRRTRVGSFTLAEAHTLEDMDARREAGTLAATLRSIPDALAEWPRVVLNVAEVERIAHGQAIASRKDAKTRNEDELTLLLDDAGEAVGVARRKDGALAPVKVLGSRE